MKSTATCRPLLLLVVALSLLAIPYSANAWAPPMLPTVRHFAPWKTASFMSTDDDTETDSKEDEITKLEQELKIAKLEAELRQLKGEQSSKISTEEPPTKTGPTKAGGEEEDEEILEEASMDMFLSEGWKEAREGYDPKNTATVTRQNEEQGNLLGLVGKVVGGIVALVVFSQIPVGQEDLSKYSAIKSGPTKTSIDLGDTNRVKGQTLNANSFYDSSNEYSTEDE